MKKLVCLLEVTAMVGCLAFATQAHAQATAAPAAATATAPATAPAAAPADPNAAPAPGPAAEPAPVAAAPVEAAPAAAAPAAAPVLTEYELRRMPKRMKYREGYPVPDGYVISETPLRGLMIGGIVMVGVPYLTGLVIAGSVNPSFGNQGGWLAVPVAGPWLTYLLRTNCTSEFSNNVCDADSVTLNQFTRTMLLLDGGIQTIGLAMGIMGAVFTRTELVRADLATFTVVPTQMGRGGYGLAAVGTF
jgi:hypothetical protein